jgi:hypothetical protein
LAFAVSETDDVADDASETSSSAPDVALVPAETLVVVPGEFNNTGTNPSSPSPPGFAGRGGGGGGSAVVVDASLTSKQRDAKCIGLLLVALREEDFPSVWNDDVNDDDRFSTRWWWWWSSSLFFSFIGGWSWSPS